MYTILETSQQGQTDLISSKVQFNDDSPFTVITPASLGTDPVDILAYVNENYLQTKEEMEAHDEAHRQRTIANAYSDLRLQAYRQLNQDEMRFDDAVNSTTTWVDAILAIKAAHPKP
jgi:hypothetical protein